MHPKVRLQKAQTTLWLVQKICRQLKHLQACHKLRVAQACIDAVYLYGLEVTSGTA